MSIETLTLVVASISLPLAAISMYAALRSNRTLKVQASAQGFKDIRDKMWDLRPQMISAALDWHVSEGHYSKFPLTSLLQLPSIPPSIPCDLAAVRIHLDPRPFSPQHSPFSATRSVVPLSSAGKRYSSYTAAIAELARPKLFFNAPIYALVAWRSPTAGPPELTFRVDSYFNSLDTQEALSHELAACIQTAIEKGSKPRLGSLPLRRQLTDIEKSASMRALSLAICTLTILKRTNGRVEFLLSKRSRGAAATSAGQTVVSPTGVFQPASQSPASIRSDFGIDRTLMREFAEEVLGRAESDGTTGETIDYDRSCPYSMLSTAIKAGGARMYYLGMGLDPCELSVQMLTALILEEDAITDVASKIVVENPEGILVGHTFTEDGIQLVRFEEHEVQFYLHIDSISPASQACLQIAWEHRERLLGAAPQ